VDDSWFQVDLGEVTSFDTLRIDWELARANTYKLLISNDRQNWTNVIKDNDGIITAHDGKETVRFEPVRARYVKFQGIKRNTDYGYSFFEFGLYNLSGAEEVMPIDGTTVDVNESAKALTIDGLLMDGNLAKVYLKIVDSKGKFRHNSEVRSTETGSFKFTVKLTGNLKGTCDAYLSTDGMTEPVKLTFIYDKKD
ncbi:MAG: discoidin domain-containing protein, partial [Paenibacillus sp.]|nr:discoidin domain-containing protein [Paenibacillus sp.]